MVKTTPAEQVVKEVYERCYQRNTECFLSCADQQDFVESMEGYAQQERQKSVNEFKSDLANFILAFKWYEWRDGDAINEIMNKLK